MGDNIAIHLWLACALVVTLIAGMYIGSGHPTPDACRMTVLSGQVPARTVQELQQCLDHLAGVKINLEALDRTLELAAVELAQCVGSVER